MEYFGRVPALLREIISAEMPRIMGWTDEQKKILWENTLCYFLRNKWEFPDAIKVMFDECFKVNLAYERDFCRDAGIDYAEIDLRWDDIRAAIALRYFVESA